MPGFRRFSQAISEGDGISVIVPVPIPRRPGLPSSRGRRPSCWRDRSTACGGDGLPVLWRGERGLSARGARRRRRCVIVVEHAAEDGDLLERLHDEALELGLDVVVGVRDEEELELALERLDPEILLLSAADADDDQDALDRVLELLPDVPGGEAGDRRAWRSEGGRTSSRSSGRASTRCSSAPGDVADLVGGAPPEV